LLVVPADDFPLAGTSDVALPHELVGRPLTARCGDAFWLPRRAYPSRLRVGALPQEALRLVRRKLDDLSHRQTLGSGEHVQPNIDPEYESWIGLVRQSRELLQRRADRMPIDLGQVIPFAQLASALPQALGSVRPYALAAESGSPLLATLSEALGADDARYHEILLNEGGKLILLADENGVRGVWSGPANSPPPRLVAFGQAGEPSEVTWHQGPEGHLHRAEPHLTWVDGQVIFEIGTDPSQTLTIQR
jgi:hypothetical protein